MLNGRTAKPAHAVKTGDEILVRRRDREIVVRVIAVPAMRSISRRDASQMIEVVSEKRLEAIDD